MAPEEEENVCTDSPAVSARTDFWQGCKTGGIVLLITIAAWFLSFSFMAIDDLAILGIIGGLLLPPALWLIALVRAFTAHRFYYGMGVLSVILIPLLFFGICTSTLALTSFH